MRLEYPMNRSTALQAALALPADQRTTLVKEIWDSLAIQPEPISLSPAQEREIERCWKAYQDNPKSGTLWPTLRGKLECRA